MSQVETITTGLGSLSAGADRAQSQIAAADRHTHEVITRAAASGFAAVAAGMIQVQQNLAGIQGSIGELAGTITQARSSTAAVPQHATPEATINGLTPVQQALDHTRDLAAGVVNQVDDTQRLVARVLQGGQPGPLLQALDGVRQILGQLTQQAAACRHTVDAAINEARRLGNSGD